jgi:PhnB protein
MAFSVSFNRNLDVNKLVVTSTFDAPLKSVWDAFTNAKVLDKWWAPEPYNAVTKSMDFTEQGRWLYYMLSPEGRKDWVIVDFSEIVPLNYFEAWDAFSDENGKLKTDMPRLKWQNSFSEQKGVTTVVNTLRGETEEDLKKIVDMGFEEGYRTGLTQLNKLLQKD